MKKLAIIIMIVFLVSCSNSNIDPQQVYFTRGLSSSDIQIVKYSNYEDYSNALNNKLYLIDYSSNFNNDFFINSDLVVVQFISKMGLTCDNFSLNYIKQKDNQIIVSVTDLYRKNPVYPQITAISVYSYLIVIDKTKVEEVTLLLDWFLDILWNSMVS